MSECLRKRLHVNKVHVSKDVARDTLHTERERTQQRRAEHSAHKVSSQPRTQYASARRTPEHSGTTSARDEIMPSISRADTTSLIDMKGSGQRGQGAA